MRFTYLACEEHKKKHPTTCAFTINKNTVSCTAMSKCGIRILRKNKGRR
jgi:hypothetical protein